jgi:ZIP family zinc transporter
MDILLSLSSGIMLASSFFSLINPSIEHAKNLNLIPWIVCSIGILIGGLFLYIGDKLYQKQKKTNNIGKLILSITLHNIPEGMAVGVAFGSAAYGIGSATIMSAISLGIGIGIQNFPEGSAISFPLYKEGYSKFKAFLIGSLTAIVEPIAGIIGSLLVLKMQFILPFLLAFASGAMLYVMIVELIPESMSNEKKEQMALYSIIGFIIMMILDISLS